ncbi:MAG: hypothetical protein ABH865_09395 [Candidatus Omnitrophota bacterium]|nr:LMBR1 domain-containing protein [Candidatus Omnitrophota bacterium]
MKKTLILLIMVGLGISLVMTPAVFVQGKDRRNGNGGMRKAVLFEMLSENEKKELLQLRETDKDKFREACRVKLSAKKKELDALKESNPEEFKKVMLSMRTRMRQRLAELAKKNPEKYAQIQKRRLERLNQELIYLRTDYPNEYQALMKRVEQEAGATKKEQNAQDAQSISVDTGDIF